MSLIAVVVIASGWALWLTRDRPALALALGLFCVAALMIGLRRSIAAPVGDLRVDDHGRVFWRPKIGSDATRDTLPGERSSRGRLMVPVKWQRAERSVWIRLHSDTNNAATSTATLVIDLRLAASAAAPDDWAALQRWMIWMERGNSN